jgi:hypothetical protein
LAPLADQVQVNSVVTSDQLAPATAMDAAGNFVVVWESFVSAGSDSSLRSIQARLYTSAGAPRGPQFQVNLARTQGEQMSPAVAMDPNGRFVVVWQSNELDSGVDFDIRAQLFDATGLRSGSETVVNTWTSQDQLHPAVAMAGTHGFLVVWESDVDPTALVDFDVEGRAFDAAGAPLGPPFGPGEFLVNSSVTSDFQGTPAIDGNASGDYLVAWQSAGSAETDTTTPSIQAIYLCPSCQLQLAQFQVNDHPPVVTDDVPAVALADDGSFAVVWQSNGSADGRDTSLQSIQARIYADPFTPGSQFTVNAFTDSAQRYPAVAMDSGGRLLVAWQSYGSSGSDSPPATTGTSVQARALTADGATSGPDLQVDTYVALDQSFPAVALDASGDGVVVWQSNGSPGNDASGTSVQARRVSLDKLFLDDFETGGTASWSARIP